MQQLTILAEKVYLAITSPISASSECYAVVQASGMLGKRKADFM